MTRVSATAILALMLCVAANATEVTYDLPALTGPTPYSTMTTVIYDGAPGAVTAMSFQLEGSLDQLGLIECFSSVPPDTLGWPLSLGGLLRRAGESGRGGPSQV